MKGPPHHSQTRGSPNLGVRPNPRLCLIFSRRNVPLIPCLFHGYETQSRFMGESSMAACWPFQDEEGITQRGG